MIFHSVHEMIYSLANMIAESKKSQSKTEKNEIKRDNTPCIEPFYCLEFSRKYIYTCST